MSLLSTNHKGEIARKSMHFAIVLLNFGITYTFGHLFGIFAAVLGLVILLVLSKKYSLLVLIRSVKRKSVGEYYLFFGIIIMDTLYLHFSNFKAFVFASFIIGVVDILTVFGPKITKIIPSLSKLPKYNNKTIGGTIILIVFTFAISIILKYSLFKSVIATIALVFVDIFSTNGTDNMTLPVVSYLIAQI